MVKIRRTGDAAWRSRIEFLVRRSYVAEHRNLDIMSGRSSWYQCRTDDQAFSVLVDKCLRVNCNPFHVVRVAFSIKQIGDYPPVPSKVFDSDMIKQYRELSEGWRTELPDRLLHEWQAAKFTVEEISETIGCTIKEAGQIAFEERRLPVMFCHALFDSYRIRLPSGTRDEALRNYCLSPSAHARAASSVGFMIPRRISKYGKIIQRIRAD